MSNHQLIYAEAKLKRAENNNIDPISGFSHEEISNWLASAANGSNKEFIGNIAAARAVCRRNNISFNEVLVKE